MSTYSKDVWRFGGDRPFVVPDGSRNGRRFNINQTTFFGSDEVTTDGWGNVLDRPLLHRKPCFGRPERFIRGSCEPGREWITQMGELKRSRTHCERCPIIFACSDLCIERVESDPNINEKFEAWADQTEHLPAKDKFRNSVSMRLWAVTLHAIKAHGRWSDVNDARVNSASVVKKQESDERRRKGAKAKRAARKPKAQKVRASMPQFIAAVECERDRRLKILLDLRQLQQVPHWIKKLSPPGCERIADVWREVAILAHRGIKITGEVIADGLVRNGLAPNAIPASLRTSVYRDLKRIRQLEDLSAKHPIWEPFVWVP